MIFCLSVRMNVEVSETLKDRANNSRDIDADATATLHTFQKCFEICSFLWYIRNFEFLVFLLNFFSTILWFTHLLIVGDG